MQPAAFMQPPLVFSVQQPLVVGKDNFEEKKSWGEAEFSKTSTAPAGIYMLKVNNINTRTRCEICSKLTIKILWTCNCRATAKIVTQCKGEIRNFKGK